MSLMDQRCRLPLRLLPRRRAQIPAILGSGFFLGFAIFWMASAAGILDLDDGTVTIPPPGGWGAASFALFGLPFAAIGLGGIIVVVLKLLPGSPCYHLEINADGLLIRSLFRQKLYPWRHLPAFETLEHRRRTKKGTRISWYTVAMEGASPETWGETRQREVLRINADEYGAKNGRQDAQDLAAWLNGLRELAAEKRLSTHESVTVPPGFVANAVMAPRQLANANRASTVVRR